MILGVPVLNRHDLTKKLVDSLVATVHDPKDFELAIIDNGSDVPYSYKEFGKLPFSLYILRNDENQGYYYPLQQLFDRSMAFEQYIGLCHNDVIFHTKGWDVQMRMLLNEQPRLALVGLCGSDEVDSNGGRGGGTMCNFMGSAGYQSPGAGRKLPVGALEPAVILDSLFMMFKREAISNLEIKKDMVLGHFYDRIWPMRLIEKGWHVGVQGVDIDHAGGETMVAEPKFHEDVKAWCKKRGLDPTDNPGLVLYQTAEEEFLGEFRDQKKMIPARVSSNWEVTYGS